MDLFRFVPGYNSAIFEQGREPAFVMVLSFVVTFVLARGYTRLARKLGWGSTHINGIHTHHLVFGAIIAFLAGALEFAFAPEPGWLQLFLAAAFGGGVALVLDEFALIFHLKDVYWEHEGRKSVDAIIIGLGVGVLFLLHVAPFENIADANGWGFAGILILNIGSMLVAAYKGKIVFALLGTFVPVIGLVAAIRLAEPDSPWARRFYGTDELAKSRKRYDDYDKRWQPRRERLRDLIGGKIHSE